LAVKPDFAPDSISPNMKMYTADDFYQSVTHQVMQSQDICVAVDEHLAYIALNEVACSYLNIHSADLIGVPAIERYPEIIASRNHRNILRALNGEVIESDLVESRMGDILQTSYTPVYAGKEVKAVILRATVHSTTSR
jgi:hypothetical protein